MTESNKMIPEVDFPPEDTNSNRKRSRGSRAVKWTAIGVGGLVALVVLLITIATLWLTPSRLTDIINREANENLNADVKVHNARFTIWSTFPHLCVEIDSIRVISRSLDSLDVAIIRELPPQSKYLASTNHIKGGINLLRLLKGEIVLHDLNVDGLDLNLVSVSDSVSNFNIFPSSDSSTRIPYLSTDSLVLSNPKHLRFYSKSSSTAVDLNLEKMSLINTSDKKGKKGDNTYHLALEGFVNADVNSIPLLKSFPFDLNGKVALRFDPFAMRTSDYKIALGNTTGKLSMDLSVGENLALNQFRYNLEDFNLNRLLSYLPKDMVPVLSSVHADLVVNASAALTTPYNFSDPNLPSVEVRFNIPDGELGYTLNKSQTYSLRHVGATGILLFDGADITKSYFEVPTFHLQGDGLNLALNAKADNVFEQPEVEFSVKGDLNASETAAIIKQLQAYKPSGTLTTSLKGKFDLSDIKQGNIQNIDIKGMVGLKDFAFRYLPSGLSAKGKSLTLDFGGDANEITDSTFKKGVLNFSVSGDGLKLVAGDLSADINGLKLNFNDVKKLAKPVIPGKYKAPKSWSVDRRSLSTIPHSAEFIQVNLPENLRKEIGSWSGNFSASIANGTLLTPAFPVRNTLQGLRIDGSLDSIVLHKLRMESLSSGMTLTAKVSNLRQFLLSGSVAPLYLNIDAELDTVQINQLAGAYEEGQRILGHPMLTGSQPSDTLLTASDTTAFLIPRNLVADINASAKMTQYMNLRLYDLGTRVKVAGGNASVDHLNISSDFGNIGLGFAMNTSDMQNMGLKLNGGIKDVNLVSFFKNFHTLLLMMPQMKNLDGVLSADINATMDYFPNMFVNVPSLGADLHLGGTGLTVHQDKFIRKITKMLMIRNSNDIHIHNMNVNAHVGSNLLELYPFVFEFENYKLQMEGVNNFDGNMYYHIGVEKSPVHIPFGINIQGNFSDPQIRFGGETFKTDKASAVTRSIMETHRINMVQIARKYLREFLHKAAQSDTTPKNAYAKFGKKP